MASRAVINMVNTASKIIGGVYERAREYSEQNRAERKMRKADRVEERHRQVMQGIGRLEQGHEEVMQGIGRLEQPPPFWWSCVYDREAWYERQAEKKNMQKKE